jgi:hypothetical protein
LGGFPHGACFTIQITRMLFAARQCDCPDVVRTAAPHTHLPEMIGTPEKGRTEPSRGNRLFLLHVVKMPQNSWANGNMEHPPEVQSFAAHRCSPSDLCQGNSRTNGNMEYPPKEQPSMFHQRTPQQWENGSSKTQWRENLIINAY